jgi:hypothetical protein
MNGLLDSQVSGNDWALRGQELWRQNYQDNAAPAPISDDRIHAHQFAQHVQRQLEEQMAQFAANHEAAMADLQRSYVFVNEPVVREFFISHRTAPHILLEAVPHLQRYFKNATIFNLRATVDEYGAQTLYAVALWPGSVQDARAALDLFDDNWWIANSRQAAGDLTFTYELV